ncbi:sensor histidine kinase [Streptomyces sp. HC44]|uniref:histidine kinase n=1 Tax=Streptomyces scabichelini TaxID=2711217 RepID=A0A6G4UXJ4_9ACTN|nr:sensor histidine kinase [Streptomyces scabichelini]
MGLLVAALVVACAAAAWLGVAYLRARHRHRRAMEERGWLLEQERQRAARGAVRGERDRIARELHDIVSHNVSLMVVQAGAARDVLKTMPDEAEAAIRAVEDAGRSTMTELRHLLGVLAPSQSGEDDESGTDVRDDGDSWDAWHGDVVTAGPSLAPQPGLSALSRLVDRIAFAGLPVEVRISGEPRPLPAGIDMTAYRIVQESLTNALKHGDGGKAEVTVRYADRSLRVEVLNTGPSVLTGTRPSVGDSEEKPTHRTRAGRLDRRRGTTGEGGQFGVSDAGGAVRPTGGTGVGGPDGRTGAIVSPNSAGVAPQRSGPAGRGDGTGRGLLGLRERVAVYGGELDARRRLGGGYRVRARIPLDRP